MAIYRRRYQARSSLRAAGRWRGLPFSRYALHELGVLRGFSLYLVVCGAAPLVAAAIMYLHYNPLGLQVLKTNLDQLLPIDARFFYRFLVIQTALGSLLVAVVAPFLIAPDLANNALLLYLSRPVTRYHYLFGKGAVLVGLLSLLSWLPLTMLYLLQWILAGWRWGTSNLYIVFAIVTGSSLWILVVSLLSLAVAAWVRWRPVATFVVFGFFIATSALGTFLAKELGAPWGHLVAPSKLLRHIWLALFRLAPLQPGPPVLLSVTALGAWCALFFALLLRRLRAFEAVRG